MRHLFVRACAALLLLPVAGHPWPQPAEPGRRPITHEDVWLMKRPGALAVSPDGRWFVVSVAEPAYDDEQKSSDLWIVPSDGSAPPRRLTAGKGSEGDPAWSPDSTRIAFSAKREGDDAAQIYVLDLAGGEAQRVTNWPAGARAPRFSPDGRSILFVGLDLPRRGHRGGQPQGRGRSQGAQVQRARLRQLPDPPLGPLARRAAPDAAWCSRSTARPRRATCSPAPRCAASAATAAGSATRARRSRPPGRPTAAASCSPRRPTATRRRAPRCNRRSGWWAWTAASRGGSRATRTTTRSPSSRPTARRCSRRCSRPRRSGSTTPTGWCAGPGRRSTVAR